MAITVYIFTYEGDPDSKSVEHKTAYREILLGENFKILSCLRGVLVTSAYARYRHSNAVFMPHALTSMDAVKPHDWLRSHCISSEHYSHESQTVCSTIFVIHK